MKKILLILITVLAITFVTACSADTAPTETAPTVTPEPTPEATPESEPESYPQSDDLDDFIDDYVDDDFFDDDLARVVEPTNISIAAMRGPTALGLLDLMGDQDRNFNNYEFHILGSPDEVPPLLIRGEVDIAVVPANLAAVLYNRMEGEVQAFAVVTLGVLHVVDTTGEIHSIADLEGRTIHVSGQGATPEFALAYVLEQNGLTPGVDVNIEFHVEHTEIAALLEAGEAQVALLPEPFVSTVLARVDGLQIALDLTEEWNRVQPEYGLVMSVAIARREFIENNHEAIMLTFMQEYEDSIQFVTNNTSLAAQLAVDFDIIPNIAIAETALPRTNIVFMKYFEMKQNLLGFYQVLYNANPESIGGTMPDSAFFFIP